MSVESQYPKSMPYGMSFTPYPSISELILQLLTVNLGKSGLRVSKVILGCMTYGSKEWQKWTLGEEEAMSHIKAAWVALFFTWFLRLIFFTKDMTLASNHSILLMFTLMVYRKRSWGKRLRSLTSQETKLLSWRRYIRHTSSCSGKHWQEMT